MNKLHVLVCCSGRGQTALVLPWPAVTGEVAARSEDFPVGPCSNSFSMDMHRFGWNVLQPHVQAVDPFVVADFDGNASPTANGLDLVQEAIKPQGRDALLRAPSPIVGC